MTYKKTKIILTITNKSSIIRLVMEKMKRTILHVDVNNAFLSWTAVNMLKNGAQTDIRKIPAIIGGDEEKRSGIVLAKSMKAKEMGIVTGESIYFARKKCSNLKIFPSNFKVYYEYSNNLFKILSEYTDKIERFSIDECFLDMTNYLAGRKIEDIAIEINKRVKTELGFTVNIGIANNKLLAKMASDFQKPDKIHTLYENEIQEKMWKLPVSELFMIGKKTIPKLYSYQIKTIGDLAKTDRSFLIKKFGKFGNMMWEYANGIDNTEVKFEKEEVKCVGNSTTLAIDLKSIEEIEKVLLSLSEQVTYRLRKRNLLCSVVNVQLRTKDFKDFSHQGKLIEPSNITTKIYEKARQLLMEMYKEGMSIRLVGVRADKLIPKEEMQISLFEENEKNTKLEKLDKTIDELKNKYGYNSISRANNSKINFKPDK